LGRVKGEQGRRRERREQEESETLKGEPVKSMNRFGEEENRREEQLFVFRLVFVMGERVREEEIDE
jgi:hypothetical protein